MLTRKCGKERCGKLTGSLVILEILWFICNLRFSRRWRPQSTPFDLLDGSWHGPSTNYSFSVMIQTSLLFCLNVFILQICTDYWKNFLEYVLFKSERVSPLRTYTKLPFLRITYQIYVLCPYTTVLCFSYFPNLICLISKILALLVPENVSSLYVCASCKL